MKVIRLHGPRDLRLHDEPEPAVAPPDALFHIQAVGICGSDLHWYSHGGIAERTLKSPHVLGHEATALTEDGRLVGIEPAVPCGQCRLCREGSPNLCRAQRHLADGTTDGVLSERYAWPMEWVLPLPASIDPITGTMVEPLAAALHPVDLGKLRAGMRVGVFGCGTMGLLMVQLARAMGAAQVIATEKLPHRLDAAREFGATDVLSATGDEGAEAFARAGGEGVDVAFEAAGDVSAIQQAIRATRWGGLLVIVGIIPEKELTFTFSEARKKGMTIKFSMRSRNTYGRALRLVEQGVIDVRPYVTGRFPLEKAAEAFASAERREGIKTVIEMV
jgi:L-iditol 2-dehydrogenase